MKNISDINDMKCWAFRIAQKKWNIDAKKCSNIFDENRLYDVIEDGYEYLHLSSYENVVNELEIVLKNRGISIC